MRFYMDYSKKLYDTYPYNDDLQLVDAVEVISVDLVRLYFNSPERAESTRRNLVNAPPGIKPCLKT